MVLTGLTHQRVIVACVSFETVKVVEPCRHYKADKVYLLHKGDRAPYDAFVKEVKSQLDAEKIECVEKKLDIFKFPPVVNSVLRILRDEKANGNHVYVNIGAGPQMFSAGALVACMMEGGTPFNVGVKKYMLEDYKVYFEGEKPVGLAKEVYPPFPLPEFRLRAPRDDLIKGLAVIKKMIAQGSLLSSPNIIRRLKEEGLMDKIADKVERVTQSAVMRYRRNFLDPWTRNGWMTKEGKSKLNITETGNLMLEIFC